MARRVVMALLLVVGASQGALAQHDQLDPKQQLGRRLYEQSCGVCHTRPTLISRMYGPELSKTTVGGNQEAIKAIVTGGTERMPAFKYTYTPDQIAAIAAYIVTLAPGHQGDGK
jgi:mono/diheme cytochrome c family protein